MKTISFDAVSIEAILAGKKTQTRRPLTKHIFVAGRFNVFDELVPRWKVGDEAWAKTKRYERRVDSPFNIRITGHKVERVQDISYRDVEAEGVDVVGNMPLVMNPAGNVIALLDMVSKRLFRERWYGIYNINSPYRWENNPLCEILVFEVFDIAAVQ